MQKDMTRDFRVPFISYYRHKITVPRRLLRRLFLRTNKPIVGHVMPCYSTQENVQLHSFDTHPVEKDPTERK